MIYGTNVYVKIENNYPVLNRNIQMAIFPKLNYLTMVLPGALLSDLILMG